MTTNRKANYNYSFDETIEAGIVLKGSEIKSIRESKIDISNAFCRIQNDEVWLHNAHIAPYSNIDFQPDYNPTTVSYTHLTLPTTLTV